MIDILNSKKYLFYDILKGFIKEGVVPVGGLELLLYQFSYILIFYKVPSNSLKLVLLQFLAFIIFSHIFAFFSIYGVT